MKDLDVSVYCDCGGELVRLITQGHGGTHGDEAAWIASTNVALTHPRKDRPVTTRTEWRQRIKDKGLTPLE